MTYLETGIGVSYFITFLFVWRKLYVAERDAHLKGLDTDAKYKRRFENKKDGPSYFTMFLGAVVWPIVLVVAFLAEAIPWLWKHSIGRETPYEKQQRLEKKAKEIERLTKEFGLGFQELPVIGGSGQKWETEFDRKMKGLTLDDFFKNVENRFPNKDKSWQRGQAMLQYEHYKDEWEV